MSNLYCDRKEWVLFTGWRLPQGECDFPSQAFSLSGGFMFFSSPVSHSAAKTPHPVLTPGAANNQGKQVRCWFSWLTATQGT